MNSKACYGYVNSVVFVIVIVCQMNDDAYWIISPLFYLGCYDGRGNTSIEVKTHQLDAWLNILILSG